jgi:hypothetical protein
MRFINFVYLNKIVIYFIIFFVNYCKIIMNISQMYGLYFLATLLTENEVYYYVIGSTNC